MLSDSAHISRANKALHLVMISPRVSEKLRFFLMPLVYLRTTGKVWSHIGGNPWDS